MKTRGFTLTEMLVALLIVAVLAGIAWPVGRSMVARSKQAACLTKLRSIGIGLESYLADHNQILPPLEAGRASTREEFPVLETVLLPYMEGSKEAFHCPADHKVFARCGSSYLWNSTQSGRHVNQLAFFGEKARPERIPLVTDKEDWHPNGVNFLYADQSTSTEVRFSTNR